MIWTIIALAALAAAWPHPVGWTCLALGFAGAGLAGAAVVWACGGMAAIVLMLASPARAASRSAAVPRVWRR